MCVCAREKETHTHAEKGERKSSSKSETRDLRETVKMSQVEMSAARWRGVKLSESRRLEP